jgi:hypothetical protein
MTNRFHPSHDVLAAHLDGEAVLLDLSSKRYFRLNTTGATIWRELEAGRSTQEIADTLVSRFDVDQTMATDAVENLLAELAERGLLRADDDQAGGA